MKKILVFVSCMVGCVMVTAQPPFNIKGRLTAVKTGLIKLYYSVGGQSMVDSAEIKEGVFILGGRVAQPVKGELVLSRHVIMFYVEPGDIVIKGDSLETAQVIGGVAQEDYSVLMDQTKEFRGRSAKLLERYFKAVEEKDTSMVKQLVKESAVIQQEQRVAEDAFIRTHPASYVSWDLVKNRATLIDLSYFEPLFNGIDAKFRETEEGKEIVRRMDISRRTEAGQRAIDFTQHDADGQTVTLTSFRGKYVLLDFWASWCGPCRAENPNVLKAYHKFKGRGLDILAVSLDNNRDNWIKAIGQDGLPWRQVSDLKGWHNAVATIYGINSIPQNLLIDPNGIILAKNLRGDDLEKKLNEVIR